MLSVLSMMAAVAVSGNVNNYTTLNSLLEGQSFSIPETNATKSIKIGPGTVSGIYFTKLAVDQQALYTDLSVGCDLNTNLSIEMGADDTGTVAIDISGLDYSSRVTTAEGINNGWEYQNCTSTITTIKTTITGFSYITRGLIKHWIDNNLASVFCWKIIPTLMQSQAKQIQNKLTSRTYDPSPKAVAAKQEQKFAHRGLYNLNTSIPLGAISEIVSGVFSAPQPGGKTAFGMALDDTSLWGKHPNQPRDFPNSVILFKGKKQQSAVAGKQTSVIDVSESGGFENDFQLSQLIDFNEVLHFDDKESGVEVSVTEILINGLDTVGDMEVVPVGNYSLLTKLSLAEIDVTANLDMTLTNPITGFTTTTKATFSLIGLQNLTVSASLLTAVDPSRFRSMFVADLSPPSSKGILPLIKHIKCLTYPLIGFNISTVAVSASNIKTIKQSDIIPGINNPVNGVLEIVNSLFGSDFMKYRMPLMVGSKVAEVDGILDMVLGPFMNQTKQSCPLPSEVPLLKSNKYLMLNESGLISTIDWVVNSLLSSGNGMTLSAVLSALNLTNINMLKQPLGGSLSIGGGVLGMHLNQVSLTNLNEPQDEAKIIVPKDDTRMATSVDTFKLNVSLSQLNISFTGGNGQPPFHGVLSFDFTFEDLELAITTVTGIMRKNYHRLPLSNITNIYCLMSLLDSDDGLQLHDILLNTRHVLQTKVTVTDQIGFPGLSDFIKAFQSEGGRSQMTNGLNNMSKILNTIMNRNATQNLLNELVRDSSKKCGSLAAEPTPPPPEHTEVSDAMKDWEVFVGVYGFAAFIGMIFLGVGCCTSKNSVDSRKAASEQPEIQKSNCDNNNENDDDDDEGNNEKAALISPKHDFESKYLPLYCHPAVPFKVRIGMPIAILLTTVTFLTANILLGARVHAIVLLFGSEIRLNNVFRYTLASTISNMYNSKAYALGVIVALFSGAWPYVKLFILLFCWFVSPERISRETRGYVLRVIDILGKWSLVDDFMMVMMMVAFRMSFLPSPEWEFTDPSTFDVELVIDPCYGMYAFLTAAIATLILNHIQIIYHRNCLEFDDGYKESWLQVGKDDPTRRVLSSFQSPFISFIVVFLLFIALSLVLLGCSVHSFSFKFEGLAGGFLLATDPDSQHKPYSVFSLAVAMWNQAGPSLAGYIGYFYLMAAFVLFAFCMPVLQLFSLGVLWAAPLRVREQKLLFFMNEIIAAWSSLEVFVIALIAALMEIPEFSQFMIGSACDQINKIMSDLQGPLALSTTKCFSVEASLLPGCWILFSAAVVSNIAFQVTWKSADKLIRQMEHSAEAKRLSHSSSDESTPCDGV